jgi:ABC transporter substrate binding protein
MRRREFIALVGGTATTWPLVARAQQPERVRRIGVLMNLAADDPEGQARIAAFHQGLQEWGWTLGRNARIDVRWSAVDAESSRRYVAEVVGLAPDVILASASAAMGALQQTTRTVPVVFVTIVDPVGAGFVESLPRPGGNATGFALYEYTLSGKWLELLKEIAPGGNHLRLRPREANLRCCRFRWQLSIAHANVSSRLITSYVTRAAVLRDPTVGSGTGHPGGGAVAGGGVATSNEEIAQVGTPWRRSIDVWRPRVALTPQPRHPMSIAVVIMTNDSELTKALK